MEQMGTTTWRQDKRFFVVVVQAISAKTIQDKVVAMVVVGCSSSAVRNGVVAVMIMKCVVAFSLTWSKVGQARRRPPLLLFFFVIIIMFRMSMIFMM